MMQVINSAAACPHCCSFFPFTHTFFEVPNRPYLLYQPPLEKQYCLALSEYPLFLEKMAKNTSTTYMTADDFDNDNSPEISEPTRKSSIRNPFKSLKHFKESEKSKQHTADPNFNEPATSSSEQDTFHDLVRATQGMSPEQVKAFLATKSEADREKYKDDVRTSALVMARL